MVKFLSSDKTQFGFEAHATKSCSLYLHAQSACQLHKIFFALLESNTLNYAFQYWLTSSDMNTDGEVDPVSFFNELKKYLIIDVSSWVVIAQAMGIPSPKSSILIIVISK